MSRFIETLTALMTVEETTQATLADRSGIVQSTISRFLKNERDPSAEQVGQLCAAISQDRNRRLELLLAWARDQMAAAGLPAGLDERHFILAPSGDEPAEAIRGAGSLAAELELIGAEAAAHEDVRDVVVDLAGMIRRHRAELLDAEQNVVYQNFGDTQGQAVAEPLPPHHPSHAAADQLLGKSGTSPAARATTKKSRTESTSAGDKNRKA